MEYLDPAKYTQVEWVSSTRRIGDGYEPVTSSSPGSERSESGCLMHRNAPGRSGMELHRLRKQRS